MKMRKIQDLKSNISDILELPKDVMLDLPKITMVGNIQLYIENHRGIIEYNSQRVRINSNMGVIRIVGKDMFIKTIMSDEIIVTGSILNIEYI